MEDEARESTREEGGGSSKRRGERREEEEEEEEEEREASRSREVSTCLGYASRLSPYANRGVTGLPEKYDSSRVLTKKLAKLVELVRGSEKTVALTGAGISVSAGIPDFRGPKGIWTLEDEAKREKKTVSGSKRRRSQTATAPIAGASFETAAPTLTHMALVALAKAGKLEWCATQNVDRLHLSSGFPRSKLAILHGCVFTEQCETCHKEYCRDFDVGGVSFKPTGRSCDPPCAGVLRDTVLDWDDDLPDREWDPSARHFFQADLALCLGTSLRITPAADLPLTSKAFVVVCLQETPHDSKAALVIRAPVDRVMRHLCDTLQLTIPPPPSSSTSSSSSSSERDTGAGSFASS